MKTDNITYHDDYIEMHLNSKIYPLDIVFSAAYILMDKAYIIVDGNPKKTLIVKIRPKNKYYLKKLAYEFNDELLNYSVYKKQSEKNSKLRLELLKRALLTNLTETESDKRDYIEDKEEILVPWEEKFGDQEKKRE